MVDEGEGTVVVRRRQALLIDSVRSYRLLIDGGPAGSIRSGSEASFSLRPGAHKAQLRIDWTGSEPVTFHMAAGETVVLDVEYVGRLLSRSKYLRLVPATG